MVAARNSWQWLGDPSPQLLICGQSNRMAFLAVQQLGLSPVRISVLHQDDIGRPDESYWSEAARTDEAIPLVIAWNGNGGGTQYIFESPIPYRVFLDGEPCEDPSELVVPAEMVRAKYAAHGRQLGRVVQEIDRKNAFVLGPPPPKSTAFAQEWLSGSAALLAEVRAKGIDPATLRIAPLHVRHAHWILLEEVLREASEANGVEFISAPRSAMMDDGSLRNDLSLPDATHGNAKYAELVLDELADRFGLHVTT